MNIVILIGRITKDVELKKTTSGKSVAQFTLAVNRNFKNADGKYDADFINCVAFEQRAETISRYVHKGDRFCVNGRLSTRNYERQDGIKATVTEVMVDGFEFLESKKQTTSPDISTEEFEAIADADMPF